MVEIFITVSNFKTWAFITRVLVGKLEKMKQHWKTLSSEYLVKAPWAVLRKDSCIMPNGYIVPEYYILEYPNWVNVVALTDENKIVLVKQYRHGAQESILEIPGGVIDEGE